MRQLIVRNIPYHSVITQQEQEQNPQVKSLIYAFIFHIFVLYSLKHTMAPYLSFIYIYASVLYPFSQPKRNYTLSQLPYRSVPKKANRHSASMGGDYTALDSFHSFLCSLFLCEKCIQRQVHHESKGFPACKIQKKGEEEKTRVKGEEDYHILSKAN
ncbi:hypothetical protein M431DRAFT_300420 [Trichoderma harzianum CBS 226.95]|uniref:Uncharacterized protein n=1 Tax=Trichoderma harzianum CBS 226.95 TaxID=983964 RepID=A0A2T4AQI6_TRIHA|nr:hypothetical protein M431DRAFT_300420 [Trichoderma harzianum CBS 226.95]PTB59326.1 hypothetical protein M431DRAFT_300420 [Trichoderma harzianum CBS 226.95]